MPDFKDYAGRGWIIYKKNTLEAYQVNLGNLEFIEYNAIGVKCSNYQKLLIVCVYRSPSVTDPECITELSTILTTKKVDNINYNYTLILGDFNFREIDWTSQTKSTSENHITTRFLEAVRDSFLIQHVCESTRFRATDVPSLIDLVFTNEEGMIDCVDHNPPLGNSDHEVLCFKLELGSDDKEEYLDKICYFKGDYDAFNAFLSQVDWRADMLHRNVEDEWGRFADILSNTIQENIPVRKPQSRKLNTPWMNQPTLESIPTKRKLWKKFKYCRSDLNKANYDRAKRESSIKVKVAKSDYEKSVAINMKDGSKIFWFRSCWLFTSQI